MNTTRIMTVLLASLAVAAGGCSKKKPTGQAADQDKDNPTATQPAAPSTDAAGAAANAPAEAVPPPCPAAEDEQAQQAVQAALARLWSAEPDQHLTLLECTPVRTARGPAWLFHAWLDTGDDPDDPADSELRRTIVTPTYDAIASAAPESIAPWQRAEGWGSSIEVVDLDGDHVDEVLERYDISKGGYNDHFADVYRIAAGTLVELESFRTRFDNSGAVVEEDESDGEGTDQQLKECSAELSISKPDAKGARTIFLRADNPRKIEECISADTSYVLQGGVLIEKK